MSEENSLQSAGLAVAAYQNNEGRSRAGARSYNSPYTGSKDVLHRLAREFPHVR